MEKIYNSKNELIVLNARELKTAEILTRQTNALGYDINITTLTTIMKKVSEQKFFEVHPADYLPIRVGEGAWSQQLTTYRSFQLGDDFSTGLVNTSSNGGRLAMGDAGVDSISVKVSNWAKEIGWTLFDLEFASKAGNWDLVTAKEKARKRNWDLGIQKTAFLGQAGDSATLGLYTQTGVTNNTAFITAPIFSLSTANLKAFVAGVMNVYRTNCARTAMPSHFIMPESDFLGCAAQVSPDFAIKTILELLTEAFKAVTGNPNFKVLPCAYGDVAYAGLSPAWTTARYVMLNYDEESLRMDLPVDYTNTLANSINNFSFQNVGYGQFTGVQAYRHAEMMYFSY